MLRRTFVTLMAGPAFGAEAGEMEREIYGLVNRERLERGLSALRWVRAMEREARTHARNIARRKVAFGHDGFKGRMQRISRAVPYSGGAENVAMEGAGEDAARRAVRHWLASPPHARNILSGAYSMTAVGASRATDGSLYFVQLFVSGTGARRK